LVKNLKNVVPADGTGRRRKQRIGKQQKQNEKEVLLNGETVCSLFFSR